MFPAAVKSFFGLYPESCRFRRYMVWSVLLTPPFQPTGGAGTAANAFIAWLCWFRCAARAAEVERLRIARLTRRPLVIVSSSLISPLKLLTCSIPACSNENPAERRRLSCLAAGFAHEAVPDRRAGSDRAIGADRDRIATVTVARDWVAKASTLLKGM